MRVCAFVDTFAPRVAGRDLSGDACRAVAPRAARDGSGRRAVGTAGLRFDERGPGRPRRRMNIEKRIDGKDVGVDPRGPLSGESVSFRSRVYSREP